MSEKRGRYFVFGCYDYYPSGGLNDVVFSTDDREEAIRQGKDSHYENVEVWDRIDDEIIFEK